MAILSLLLLRKTDLKRNREPSADTTKNTTLSLNLSTLMNGKIQMTQNKFTTDTTANISNKIAKTRIGVVCQIFTQRSYH